MSILVFLVFLIQSVNCEGIYILLVHLLSFPPASAKLFTTAKRSWNSSTSFEARALTILLVSCL
jgi:hypothetical protein